MNKRPLEPLPSRDGQSVPSKKRRLDHDMHEEKHVDVSSSDDDEGDDGNGDLVVDGSRNIAYQPSEEEIAAETVVKMYIPNGEPFDFDDLTVEQLDKLYEQMKIFVSAPPDISDGYYLKAKWLASVAYDGRSLEQLIEYWTNAFMMYNQINDSALLVLQRRKLVPLKNKKIDEADEDYEPAELTEEEIVAQGRLRDWHQIHVNLVNFRTVGVTVTRPYLHIDDRELKLPEQIYLMQQDALIVEGQYSKHQNLLLFLEQRAQQMNLRKKHDSYYIPERTLDGKFSTRSYRHYKDIKDFIQQEPDRLQYPLQWGWLTDGSHTGKMAEHLIANKSPAVPHLVRRRGVWSFNNGIFHAREYKFTKYEDLKHCAYFDSARMATTKYIQVDFHDELYSEVIDGKIENMKNLPTPGIETIFDHQGFTDEVKAWIYAFIGRLFFEVNSNDSWQVMPFFVGTAGCGKSTILNAVKNLFLTDDVGVITNRMERDWVASSLYDKLIVLGMDVGEKLTVDRSEWQSWVSGEACVVKRKYKDALNLSHWTVPMVFAGNTLMKWTDEGGSVVRRLMIIMMEKGVKKRDGNLDKKIADEVPAFLKKTVGYYHATSQFYSTNISNVVPDFFVRNSNELRKATNALYAYIKSSHVVLGESQSVPLDVFRNLFNTWCRNENMQVQRLTKSLRCGVFNENNITEDHRNGKVILHGINIETS